MYMYSQFSYKYDDTNISSGPDKPKDTHSQNGSNPDTVLTDRSRRGEMPFSCCSLIANWPAKIVRYM